MNLPEMPKPSSAAAFIIVFCVLLTVQIAMAVIYSEPLFILWAASSGWAIDVCVQRLRSGRDEST
jgi:hypothetical protein